MDDVGSLSYGYCQIKLDTAKMFSKKVTGDKLMVPGINIYLAGKYLQYQLDRYVGCTECAVSAYNAGTAIKSNFKYVNKVKERLDYYEQNY